MSRGSVTAHPESQEPHRHPRTFRSGRAEYRAVLGLFIVFAVSRVLYGLAGVPVPIPQTGEEYPGYPLVADGWIALPWFFVALPLLIAVAWWWWNRRVPRIPSLFVKNGGQL